jgi:hypothetical protein
VSAAGCTSSPTAWWPTNLDEPSTDPERESVRHDSDTAVHVGSRRIQICAEEITLGTALSAGEREFTAVASVIMMTAQDEPTVVSPRGVCREVLSFAHVANHGPVARPVRQPPGDPLPAAVAAERAAASG